MGVDHRAIAGQNRSMLGDEAAAPAKQYDIARAHVVMQHGDQMADPRLRQRLNARGFRPIARIGRNALRLLAIERASHATHKAKAIAANAFQRGLMPVGRADPLARLRDDVR